MSGDILAQLLRQGAERGADLVTLRAIAEEAGELAATRAIERLGLSDAGAGGDLRELRAMLGAWRDARRSAWTAVFGWAARAAAALLLAGWALQGWLE